MNQPQPQESNPLANIEQKMNLLQSENTSLKSQLQSLSEKETLYKDNLAKIKLIQSEQEKSFFTSINDSKRREEELKQKFLDFQKLLESQYSASEARFNDEMNQMNQEIGKRDNIINNLRNELNQLEEKMVQEELNYNFKEKEFENVIKIKERKLEELNEAVKQITKEATEEIQRMSEQLEDFQRKSKNNFQNTNNNINNNNNLNNDNIDNNNLKNENLRLRIENKNLRMELEKRNNELKYWKTKKNNSNISNKSDALKELEINQLKRTLLNYGNKIKLINDQYQNLVMSHQREKKSLLNQIKNLNNKNIINNRLNNRFTNKLNNYNNFNNEYNYTDINQLNNENNDLNILNSNIYQENDNIDNINNFNNNDIENIENVNEVNDINELNEDLNSHQELNGININNLDQNENEYLNQDLNEEGEINDIKELNASNDDNDNEEVYEPLDDIDQNLNINNNIALINRMQNNIPSVEARRNELINNQLKNLPKSDYEE